MDISTHPSIRARKVGTWELFGLGFVLILLFSVSQGATIASLIANFQKGFTNLSSVGPGGGGSGSGIGAPCAASNPWVTKVTEQAYGSDALNGTVAINGFASGNPITAVSDLTGTSSPVTSVGTYVPNGNNIFQVTETSTVTTYPEWFPFSGSGVVAGTPSALFTYSNGVVGATLGCAPSSSNSAAQVWNVIATPLQAPSNGASNTNDVKVLCISSAGTKLNGATNSYGTLGTSQTLITCYLQITQKYRAIVGSVPLYATQANPLYNYASGSPVSGNSILAENMVALVIANRTGVTAPVDASAPGLSETAITSNLITNTGRAWIITGFSGCGVSPGSTSSSSPVNCLTLPLDVTDTTGGTNHVEISIIFVDMQQAAYIINNLTTPSASTFTTSGAINEALDSDEGYSSGLTPTSGPNAGSPAPLCQCVYGIDAVG